MVLANHNIHDSLPVIMTIQSIQHRMSGDRARRIWHSVTDPRLLRFATGLFFVTTAAAACFDNKTVGADEVKAYHEAMHPQTNVAVSEEIDAYFDYSLGMGEGMRATAVQNQALSDFLRGRRARYFRVGSSPEPELIPDMASPQATLLNLDNFRDIGSRLHRVIDMAVAAETRQSVFVTDFEATLDDKVMTPGAPLPHRIDTKAWAQESFRRWLEAGHRIDVFARRYSKPDWWFSDGKTLTDNWIYTIVFTPGPLMRDPKAYAGSLLAYLLEEQSRRESESERHFAYWADDFLIAARNNKDAGNANPSSPVQEAAIGAWRPPFDFHRFSYKEIEQWLEAASDDQRLLNGVTIEPRLAFARTVTLGLEVHDVTGVVTAISEAMEPPTPPDTLVDPETGAITLVDKATGEEVSAVPPPPPAKGQVGPSAPRGEVSAVPAPPPDNGQVGPSAPGVLVLVHNVATHEVGIKLDSTFTGPLVPTVYKADVIVEAVTLDDNPEAASVLSLSYSGGFRVNALGESLRLALRDVANAMRGKVLYSSYLGISP
jgi:hypothetical protein